MRSYYTETLFSAELSAHYIIVLCTTHLFHLYLFFQTCNGIPVLFTPNVFPEHSQPSASFFDNNFSLWLHNTTTKEYRQQFFSIKGDTNLGTCIGQQGNNYYISHVTMKKLPKLGPYNCINLQCNYNN